MRLRPFQAEPDEQSRDDSSRSPVAVPHGRDRSRQVGGAQGLRPPRRGGHLERRDRPQALRRSRGAGRDPRALGRVVLGPDGAVDRGEVATRLLRPRAARVARGAPAPSRRARLPPAGARSSPSSPTRPRCLRHRGAAPRRGRREKRFDAVVSSPLRRRSHLAPVRGRSRTTRPPPRPTRRSSRRGFSYVNDGSLDELDAFVADVVTLLAREVLIGRRPGPAAAAWPTTWSRRRSRTWYVRLPVPSSTKRSSGATPGTTTSTPCAARRGHLPRRGGSTPTRGRSSGAIGLMQLLPTPPRASRSTRRDASSVDDLYDPEINVRYGSFYLGTC